MKTLVNLMVGIIVGTFCICKAQSIASQQTQVTVPAAIPYAIATQDANSRVWQSKDYQISPSGEVITNIHSVTELCSGLNHWVNGQWVASSEQIDILPNSTAAATNGQHQAYFPGDIYEGQIELVTPDGQHLQSRPMALVYFDGTNTVVIAELTNSVGLVGNNQVIYPDAFTDFKVDLRYTYTKAGFEQDIILRQQPPTPESLGLNPDTTRLQIMTEFFATPQPTITSTALPIQAGITLNDESLGFGTMQMVPGRAFLMGQNAQDAGAMVSKHWLIVNGRQILIEEVPVDAILEGLSALPLTAMNSKSSENIRTASKHFQLPPQRLIAKNSSKNMMLAKGPLPAQGFVLDYQTVTGSLTNYTYQGDTTYYISGSLNSYGTNTFEGNAVIKFATNGVINIITGVPGVTTGINWKGSAYRPVIFTALDDNSVGETPTNSTGNPAGKYYGNGMLSLSSLPQVATLTGLRMSYAKTAIVFSGASANIYDAQFVNCQYCISGVGANIALRNALCVNVNTNFNGTGGGFGINAQNVTVSGSKYLLASPSSPLGISLTLSNCIFANITNLSVGFATPGGSYNGFYATQPFGTVTNGTTTYPFQAVGAGNYYLANGSSFQNAGTTNLDATLLADIRSKTTFPPILYSNVSVSINTTLNPQVQRDTDTPDLGYHYDPIDYLVDQYVITNAALILTNGVALAGYNDTDLTIGDGSSIVSIGSPLYPNWLVRYSSVQEEPILLGSSGLSAALSVNPNHVSVAPIGQFRFTKFACPAGGGEHLYDYQNNWSYSYLQVQDCEFWSGANFFAGNTNTVAILKNNLFARSAFSAVPQLNTSISYLYLTNNLFWGSSSVAFSATNRAAASTNWCVFNNDFDSCGSIGITNVSITNGNNAYFNSTGYVYPTNTTDILSTKALIFQSGPLGTFYQPSTSSLINMGSTNANLVGFYHYTVITNLVSGLEIKETNSIIDIGYHYVATDANGIPIDTDGDGMPDYLEDANGNGTVDSGESSWTNYNSANGLTSGNNLLVFTPLK